MHSSLFPILPQELEKKHIPAIQKPIFREECIEKQQDQIQHFDILDLSRFLMTLKDACKEFKILKISTFEFEASASMYFGLKIHSPSPAKAKNLKKWLFQDEVPKKNNFKRTQNDLKTIRQFLIELLKIIHFSQSKKLNSFIISSILDMENFFVLEEEKETEILFFPMILLQNKRFLEQINSINPSTSTATRISQHRLEIDPISHSFRNFFFQIFVDHQPGANFDGQFKDKSFSQKIRTVEQRIDQVFNRGSDFILSEGISHEIVNILEKISSNDDTKCGNLLQEFKFFNLGHQILENLDSLFHLALKYDEGFELERDYFKARKLLERAKKKHPPSCFLLGIYDIAGRAGKMNKSNGETSCRMSFLKTIEILRPKCQEQTEFKQFYQYVMGLALEFKNSLQNLSTRRNSITNSPCDMLNENSQENIEFEDKINELFDASAKLGHSGAISRLGMRLIQKSREASQTQAECTSNLKKGVCMLQRAASKSESNALLNLGYLYMHQSPVISRDVSKSFHFFCEAAKMGEANGFYEMGSIQRSGDRDFSDYTTSGTFPLNFTILKDQDFDEISSENLKKSIRNFAISAEMGHIRSLITLGDMLFFGDDIPRDTEKAVIIFKLLADQGQLHGLLRLFEIFKIGDGCQKNDALALHYLMLACRKQETLDWEICFLLAQEIEESCKLKIFKFVDPFDALEGEEGSCFNNPAIIKSLRKARRFYEVSVAIESFNSPARARLQSMEEDGMIDEGNSSIFEEF